MTKFSSLFIIVLLLLFSLTHAARPEPGLPNYSAVKTQHADPEAESVDRDESCDGIGEEECLMRRSLTAHIDYIYTQKNKP